MIAHLLAAAVFVTAAASPTVTSIEAAPLAQVRVVAGSVGVWPVDCTERWCHPFDWLNEGDTSPVRIIDLADGQYWLLVNEGWIHCDLPYDDQANYEIVTGNIVIAECADYATS